MKSIRLLLLPALLFLGGCQVPTGSETRAGVTGLIIAVIGVMFVVLARYSNLLRDEVNDCNAFDAEAAKLQRGRRTKVSRQNPYSLTKVQFGLWTVIISSAYVYLSLFRGDCAQDSINKTALVLMGIFAATTAASTIIDKREINDNRPRHQNMPSQGLFIDILSDDNGISLHRFQNFAWTLVAITVYLYKLTQNTTGCQLPELSDTLLALTGLSSATFVVLRAQENDPAIEAAQDASAAAPGAPAGDPGSFNGPAPSFTGASPVTPPVYPAAGAGGASAGVPDLSGPANGAGTPDPAATPDAGPASQPPASVA